MCDEACSPALLQYLRTVTGITFDDYPPESRGMHLRGFFTPLGHPDWWHLDDKIKKNCRAHHNAVAVALVCITASSVPTPLMLWWCAVVVASTLLPA